MHRASDGGRNGDSSVNDRDGRCKSNIDGIDGIDGPRGQEPLPQAPESAASSAESQAPPLPHDEAAQPAEHQPQPQQQRVLFVGGLDMAVTEFRLKRLFEKHGPITQAGISSLIPPQTRDNPLPFKQLDFHWHRVGPRAGHPKGSAFVRFQSDAHAAAAIAAMHATTPAWNAGRKLTVAWSTPPKAADAVGSNSSLASSTNPATIKRIKTRQEYREMELLRSVNKKIQPIAKPELSSQQISIEGRIAAIEKKLKSLHSSPSFAPSSTSVPHPRSNGPRRQQGGNSKGSVKRPTASLFKSLQQ
ncbi:hypothetical protein HDU84_003974 [Entophlyctis sp. JEL0112]|nr:hypothetical protein HDU84_003974 [Entophlyctis sp. JEL0112]